MPASPKLKKSRAPSVRDGTSEDLLSDPEEPVYLLSLDGGGVRGISEAVILHQIMLRIQRKLGLVDLPRPCDYFHIIAGTSTGGLIAIMLGRLRMSTREVIDQYETIAKQIFSFKNRRPDMSFRKTALERSVSSLAARHVGEKDTRMISNNERIKKGLSFVVSLRKGGESGDDNTPVLFRSYKGKKGETPDCEIWEAARATTAAPRYFAPAQLKLGDKESFFIDGAVKWNNPTKLLLEEAESHLGPHRTLGCLVSLGTGLRPSPLREKGGGKFWKSYSVFELLKMVADMLTDPEGVHQTIEDRLKGHLDSYFRFTVPYVEGQERIRIHEYKRMRALREATEEYLAQNPVSDKLDELVDVLTHKTATDLTLHAACHANSIETSMEQITHELRHRKKISPMFTGREGILGLLDDEFCRRQPGSHPRRDYWLLGVGGVGKTQIALQFIDLHRDRFDRVFWIDATTPFTDYQKIASKVLDHPPTGTDVVPAVINWLEATKEEWLLVIDGYDKGDLSRWLPGNAKGNILFTSTQYDRLPRPPKDCVYNVPGLDLHNSTTLLLRAANLDEDSEDLRTRAAPLVEELGELPLALDHAGAFIRENSCSLERYAAVFRQNKKDVLRDPKRAKMTEAQLTVYATFDLTLKRLRVHAASADDEYSETAVAFKSALQFLNAFCFYHHQDIPLEIIARAFLNLKMGNRWDDIWEIPGDVTDDESVQPSESGSEGRRSTESGEPIENIVLGMCPGMRELDIEYMRDGINLLVRFSFLWPLSSDEAVYRIHPLVHSWIRDRMTAESYEFNLRIARTVLFHAYHPDMTDADSERFYPRLLPHMQANNRFQRKDDGAVTSLEEMEATYKYTMILKRLCLWDEAIPLMQQTISDLTREFNPNDTRTLANMMNLGRAYMAVGKMGDAEGTFKEVLERARNCTNARRAMKHVINAWCELAMTSLAQGDLACAKGLAEAAAAATEQHRLKLQAPRPRLCLVYQYLGRYEEAEALAAAVLDSMAGRRVRGPEHHKTLRAAAELARVRERLGRLEEAERDLVGVARKFERDVGPRNVDTLVVKSDLAWVISLDEDRLAEAEELQRGTLETAREALGEENLYTLLMVYRLGLVVGEAGRFGEARALLKECARGREDVLGKKHVAVVGVNGAVSLLLERKNGSGYLERLGHSREDVEMLEDGRRLAGYPFAPVLV